MMDKNDANFPDGCQATTPLTLTKEQIATFDSNYEASMLALYKAQIEEYLVKPGFAEKGDLIVKLLPTSKDREASVEIISLSGKNVTQIFRRAFPEEHPPETIPEVHAEMKTIARSIIASPPVPDRPMNRAERRAKKRGRRV